MVVTGDDEGYVKVWDLRQSKKAMQYRAHEDYITDTACREGRNMLLASSYVPRQWWWWRGWRFWRWWPSSSLSPCWPALVAARAKSGDTAQCSSNRIPNATHMQGGRTHECL